MLFKNMSALHFKILGLKLLYWQMKRAWLAINLIFVYLFCLTVINKHYILPMHNGMDSIKRW